MGIIEGVNSRKQAKRAVKETKLNNKRAYKDQLKTEKKNFKPLKEEFLRNGAQTFQNVYIDYSNKKMLLIDSKKHAAVSKDFSEIKYYSSKDTMMTTAVKSKHTIGGVQNTANVSFTIGFFDGDVRTVTIYSNLVQVGKMKRYAAEIENALRKIVEDNNQETDEETQSEQIDISQLSALKNLADEGVITQEEFEAKKKQVLGL